MTRQDGHRVGRRTEVESRQIRGKGAARRTGKRLHRRRGLSFESLEQRQLLSISVADSDPNEGSELVQRPDSVAFTFTQPVDPASLDPSDVSFAFGEGSVEADWVAVDPGDPRRVEFGLPADFFDGSVVVTLGAQSIAATDDGSVGPANPYSISFTIADAPAIVQSPVSTGDVLDSGPVGDSWWPQFQVDEPFRGQNLDAADFSLEGLRSGALAPYASDPYWYDEWSGELYLNFGSEGPAGYRELTLVEDIYTLTVRSGDEALEDLAGNDLDGDNDGLPGGDYVVQFSVDTSEPRALTSLQPVAPLGSQVYSTTATAVIGNATDSDHFELELDAGQIMSLAIQPDTALRARVELFAPDGGLLGFADAVSVGEGVVLQTIPVVVGGTYTVAVRGLDGTLGMFTARVILNAAAEAEAVGAGSNDSLAIAENIDSSFLTLGGAAQRGAVLGELDMAGQDVYSFDLAAGQSASLVLATSGGSAGLELVDGAGVALAQGAAGYSNVTRAISGFVAAVQGRYYAVVTGQTTDYSLVITRDAAFDLEPNSSPADAQPLGPSASALGYLGDADEYLLSVQANDALSLNVSIPAAGAGEPVNDLVATLQLFDPDGVQIGSGTSIEHTALANGLYRVRVSALSGQGTYLLETSGATGAETFAVAASEPADGYASSAFPSTYTVHLSDALLLPSIDADDLVITQPGGGVIPATGVTLLDPDTLRFDIAAAQDADGTYTVQLAAGALTSVAQVGLSAFSATLKYDTTGPVVSDASVAEGASAVGGLLTVEFEFNEALATAGLGPEDVTLFEATSGATMNANQVSYDADTQTLAVTFNDVPEGELTLTLLSSSSALRDTVGNLLDGNADGTAGDPYVLHFSAEDPVVPFATPLAPVRPDGSLVYDATQAGVFNAPGDEDAYSIELEAGQTATLILVPQSGTIQAELELLGPDSVSLGSVAAAAAGQTVYLQTLPVAAAGTYTVRAASLVGTGAYAIELILSAAIETEPYTAVANDTAATAENIDGTAVPIGGGADRLAVLGTLASDTDVYAFSLAEGQWASVSAWSWNGTPVA